MSLKPFFRNDGQAGSGRAIRMLMNSVGFFVSVGFLLTLTGLRSVHEFHASVTQIQYSPSEKAFEISVRMFTDDLEEALSAASGRKIQLQPNVKNDPVIETYVRAHFAYMTPQKQIKPIEYVGYETEAEAHWIYFQLPYSEPFRGGLLKQNVLMELFDDQVNMVNIQYQGQKKTFVFRKNQPIQDISF